MDRPAGPRRVLLGMLALLIAACAPGDRPEPAFYLGGIQVHEDDLGRWLDALAAHGMNTLSVTDYARHGEWDGDDLRWDEGDPGILAELRAAEERGFKVVLILRVDLDPSLERNRFLWHGMILPRTDELLHSWFDRYTRFALRWAEIAEREGVDVLMIGSELNALASTVPLTEVPVLEEYFLNEDKQAQRKSEVLRHQRRLEEQPAWRGDGGDGGTAGGVGAYLDARIANERAWAAQVAGAGDGALELDELNRRRRLLESRWIELVERVREVYRGPIGYAANFDQYREVGFWPHLDVMGINAYFKLRDRPLPAGVRPEADALLARLEDGWREALEGIAELRAARGITGQPVLFTEMGYTWRLNSTLEPWADDGFSLLRYPDEQAFAEGRDPTTREEVIVWRDQPEALWERALAVRALDRVHRRLEAPFLRGILYWKLSTVASHHDIESFVVLLNQEPEDPVLPELRRFLDPPAGVPAWRPR